MTPTFNCEIVKIIIYDLQKGDLVIVEDKYQGLTIGWVHKVDSTFFRNKNFLEIGIVKMLNEKLDDIRRFYESNIIKVEKINRGDV